MKPSAEFYSISSCDICHKSKDIYIEVGTATLQRSGAPLPLVLQKGAVL